MVTLTPSPQTLARLEYLPAGGGGGGGFGAATAVGAGATAPTDEFAQHQQQLERLVVYEVAVTTGAERGAGTSAGTLLYLLYWYKSTDTDAARAQRCT
jgi:hypothetical protein